MNKEILLKELNFFTEEELKEIKSTIDYILEIKKGGKDSTTLDLLYTILMEKLQENNLVDSFPSLTLFKKRNSTSYKALVKLHQFLNTYGESLIKRKLTKNEKARFYKLYTNSIMEYLSNVCTPNLSLLLNSYNNFSTALGVLFPSYIESGLLEVIFIKGEESNA